MSDDKPRDSWRDIIDSLPRLSTLDMLRTHPHVFREAAGIMRNEDGSVDEWQDFSDAFTSLSSPVGLTAKKPLTADDFDKLRRAFAKAREAMPWCRFCHMPSGMRACR